MTESPPLEVDLKVPPLSRGLKQGHLDGGLRVGDLTLRSPLSLPVKSGPASIFISMIPLHVIFFLNIIFSLPAAAFVVIIFLSLL